MSPAQGPLPSTVAAGHDEGRLRAAGTDHRGGAAVRRGEGEDHVGAGDQGAYVQTQVRAQQEGVQSQPGTHAV